MLFHDTTSVRLRRFHNINVFYESVPFPSYLGNIFSDLFAIKHYKIGITTYSYKDQLINYQLLASDSELSLDRVCIEKRRSPVISDTTSMNFGRSNLPLSVVYVSKMIIPLLLNNKENSLIRTLTIKVEKFFGIWSPKKCRNLTIFEQIWSLGEITRLLTLRYKALYTYPADSTDCPKWNISSLCR